MSPPLGIDLFCGLGGFTEGMPQPTVGRSIDFGARGAGREAIMRCARPWDHTRKCLGNRSR